MPQLADRRDDLEVGGERPGRDLEADLVVALAGAAVGDARRRRGRGPSATRCFTITGRRQRRDQRVAALVHGVGLEGRAPRSRRRTPRGQSTTIGVDGTGGRAPLADRRPSRRPPGRRRPTRQITSTPELLDHPADGHGGVETTAVGQYHSLRHVGSSSVRAGSASFRRVGQPGRPARAARRPPPCRRGPRPRRRSRVSSPATCRGCSGARPVEGRADHVGRCRAACAARRGWPSGRPRRPSRPAPGGGGPRGPAGPSGSSGMA